MGLPSAREIEEALAEDRMTLTELETVDRYERDLNAGVEWIDPDLAARYEEIRSR